MDKMEKMRLYEVTKGSSDGTFQKGDLIWMSDNEDINNVRAGGFLSKEDWNQERINDFECQLVDNLSAFSLVKVGDNECVVKKKALSMT